MFDDDDASKRVLWARDVATNSDPALEKQLISEQSWTTRRLANQIQNLNEAMVVTMTEQRYRGGRNSKGDRLQLISRVATPVGEAVRESAEARGMSVNDFIASVLAREVGMADLAPQYPVRQMPQELPIADVA
jgi:predicted HicB family RNase H-like nuclease